MEKICGYEKWTFISSAVITIVISLILASLAAISGVDDSAWLAGFLFMIEIC
jgi:hypothetical protein